MAATYPADIPSIRQRHQELPPVLGDHIDRYLDDSIATGDPVLRDHLRRAKLVAGILRQKYNMREGPQLTEAVVETAELRATAIDTFHASLAYPVQQLADVLQAIQTLNDNVTELRDNVAELRDSIDHMGDRMDIMASDLRLARAETANQGIRLQNRVLAPQQYRATQKTVAGSGLVLAQAVATSGQLRAGIATYATANPPRPIGATPNFYNADFEHMTHTHILRLIEFYNETMGVMVGQDLGQQKMAIKDFFQRM